MRCLAWLVLLPLLATACVGPRSLATEDRIARIERGLRTDYGAWWFAKRDLAARMEHHEVPGLSIAFVSDGAIAWTRQYGVADVATGRPVTADTLFQAASISKPVSAAVVLELVADGTLGLDDDVAELLTSWSLPPTDLTIEEPVTPRRLLSHTAGTTVHGFPGYSAGNVRPSLRNLLNGLPPANSPSVVLAAVPGSRFAYSGGGYCILQQAVEDVTGRAFIDLARELVLAPAGMHDSTFDPDLPPDRAARVAIGHRAGGLPIDGGWHRYPEHMAASLWTTPSDLARFAIAIMASLEGAPGALLDPDLAVQMTSAQDPEGTYGLGFYLGNDGGDRVYFLHGGANEGYRCGLVVYPRFRQAVAIMTNADGGAGLWREVLRSVSIEYGWVD